MYRRLFMHTSCRISEMGSRLIIAYTNGALPCGGGGRARWIDTSRTNERTTEHDPDKGREREREQSTLVLLHVSPITVPFVWWYYDNMLSCRAYELILHSLVDINKKKEKKMCLFFKFNMLIRSVGRSKRRPDGHSASFPHKPTRRRRRRRSKAHLMDRFAVFFSTPPPPPPLPSHLRMQITPACSMFPT